MYTEQPKILIFPISGLLRNLRSVAYECLLWCFTLQHPMWARVLQIHNCIANLCPQKHKQILVMHHGLHRNNDRPILPLYNPIMLRVVGLCLLPLDPCLLAEINELCRGGLTPTICPRYLDLPSCHVLHLSFKSSEVIEDLILGLHEVDLSLPGKIINEVT